MLSASTPTLKTPPNILPINKTLAQQNTACGFAAPQPPARQSPQLLHQPKTETGCPQPGIAFMAQRHELDINPPQNKTPHPNPKHLPTYSPHFSGANRPHRNARYPQNNNTPSPQSTARSQSRRCDPPQLDNNPPITKRV